MQVPRHHTDHGVAHAAQHQRAAEDAGVAPEAALPEALAEEDDGLGPRLLLIRAESAADDRRLSQGREGPRCDLTSVDPLGLAHRPGGLRPPR